MYRTYQNALWQTQSLSKLATARKAKPEKDNKGPSNTLLTEQQVLECRARHEFFNWTSARCAKYYGTTSSYMYQLLDYRLRSKLIAKPHHANIN